MVAKFKDLECKQNFLFKKYEKRSLLSREVGLNVSADQQLYIRDQLTNYKMKLYREARIIKEKYNYKYLWMKNAKIYLRK